MPKILFADDSITVRKVAERQLAEAGLDVVFVASGEEALAWLAQDRADLVISDVIMPDRSGYDVCAYVRSDPRLADTRVLLITGIVNEEVTRQAVSCRADGVVKKPFQGTSLRDQVLALLAKPQASPPAPVVQPGGAVAAREPAPPPAAPKVYRITEEQLQAFRQASARIRELEAALAGEQARSTELRRRLEAMEEMQTALAEAQAKIVELHGRIGELQAVAHRAGEIETALTEAQARAEHLTGQVAALAAVLAEERARPVREDEPAECAWALEEVAALRERLADSERVLDRLRSRERELAGRLAEIARLASLLPEGDLPPLMEGPARDDGPGLA